MITETDKRALWRSIQADHPELARGLKQAKQECDEFVAIDGYPRKTARWVRSALSAHNPSLANTLEELGTVKQIFRGSARCVPVKELVEALASSQGGG